MKRTALYEEHERLNANIVPFGGFLMPLYYSSIAAEHDAVRNACGIFDVSHMGEILITGPESNEFVNHLVTNLVRVGPLDKAVYAIMCNEDGFAIDDLFVYPLESHRYLLVVNASNIQKDEQWIIAQASSFDVEVNNVSDAYGQIAIQGPRARELVTKRFGAFIDTMKFMNYRFFDDDLGTILISRSGYTGEDGFELYAKPEVIGKLWRYFIDDQKVTPCGLGARDTLRFEAALSLYGHEIDMTITPLEAGLKFAVNFDKQFIGKHRLEEQFNKGLSRRLVGLEISGRGIARGGYAVFAEDKKIGHVTTGYLLPNQERPLALALIQTPYATIGSEVAVLIRNQPVSAIVRDMKFMEKKYMR